MDWTGSYRLLFAFSLDTRFPASWCCCVDAVAWWEEFVQRSPLLVFWSWPLGMSLGTGAPAVELPRLELSDPFSDPPEGKLAYRWVRVQVLCD